MKKNRVAILAPHFPPSNLASVHRARLLSQYLPKFGWEPIVVTTEHSYYEEDLDWDLKTLVDETVRVVETRALPTKPFRIIGDIGIRGFLWHILSIRQLHRKEKVDFALLTIPSFYSALVGRFLGDIPYGIDYIDPWVQKLTGEEKVFSKQWLSLKIAPWLEPFAVRRASVISGVAEGYYLSVLERNPELKRQAVCCAMPYGFSKKDFEAASKRGRSAYIFDKQQGNVNLVYAGALLPRARGVLIRFFEGFKELLKTNPDIGTRIRLNFIGTGKNSTDKESYSILPIAREMCIDQYVTEHPQRMPYVDVLVHLLASDGIFVIGSTEPHYTPSKVYQAVQARRPVLALLHEASTAVEVLNSSRAGTALTLTESTLPDAEDVSRALVDLCLSKYDASAVDWSFFSKYSAESSAQVLAESMDRALSLKRQNC